MNEPVVIIIGKGDQMIESGEAIVVDGIEYLCFDKIELDNKQYLYLITTDEPNDVCFGEQIQDENELKVRIIGNKAEKQKLIKAMQDKFNPENY